MAERKMPTNQNLPNNSNTAKTERVTSGKVRRTVKPQSSFGSDVGGIMNDILQDIVIPAVKAMVSEGFSNMLNMLLYGDEGAPRSSKSIGRSVGRVSYGSYYREAPKQSSRRRVAKVRGSNPTDDITFPDREDAAAVLSQIREIIDVYDVASVADFVVASGLSPKPQDQRQGWYTVDNVRIVRTNDGYILAMPRPVILE